MLVRCDRFTPILDRCLVLIDEKPTETASGLLIPATAGNDYEQHRLATVVAVGPGRFNEAGERIPMPVKEGDRVLLHPNAHTVAPIVVGGVLHHVVDAYGKDGDLDRLEVLAVVE